MSDSSLTKKIKEPFPEVYLTGDHLRQQNPLLRDCALVFLGLTLPAKADASWQELGKHILGWQDNRKIAIQLLYCLFFGLWHLLATPIKLTYNLLRFFTEFLPLWFTNLAFNGGAKLLEHGWECFTESFVNEQTNLVTKVLLSLFYIGIMFMGAGVYLSGCIGPIAYLIGRNLSSPLESLESSWKNGYRLSNLLGFGGTGLLVASFFFAVHLLLIATCYALLFPLAFKAISLSILPYLSAHLPALVLNLVSQVVELTSLLLSAGGEFILPVASFLLHFTPLLNLITHLPVVAAILAENTAGIIIGALTGLSLGLVALPLKRLSIYLRDYYPTLSKQELKPQITEASTESPSSIQQLAPAATSKPPASPGTADDEKLKRSGKFFFESTTQRSSAPLNLFNPSTRSALNSEAQNEEETSSYTP